MPAMQACKPLLSASKLVIQLAHCTVVSSQMLRCRRDMPARAQVSGSLDNVGGLVLQRRLVRIRMCSSV